MAGASWGAVDAIGGCTPTTWWPPLVRHHGRNHLEYQWKATLSLPASGRYCYRLSLGSTDLLGGDPSPIFTTQVPRSVPPRPTRSPCWATGVRPTLETTPTPPGCWGSWPRLRGTLCGVGGRQRLPRRQPDQQRDLKQHGAHQCRVRSGVLAVRGQQPADVHRAGQPRHPVRVGDAQHQADQLAPGQRGGDSGRAVRDYRCVNGTLSASYPSEWYAFSAGNARYYVLSADWADTTWAPAPSTATTPPPTGHRAPRTRLLQADLAAHPTGLKFAFFHYPLYSDQKLQNSETYLEGPGSLEGLLSANHVDPFRPRPHLRRKGPTGPGTFPSYVTGGGGGVLLRSPNCRVTSSTPSHRPVTDQERGEQPWRCHGAHLGRPRVPLPPLTVRAPPLPSHRPTSTAHLRRHHLHAGLTSAQSASYRRPLVHPRPPPSARTTIMSGSRVAAAGAASDHLARRYPCSP